VKIDLLTLGNLWNGRVDEKIKATNCTKPQVRPKVEHVFGVIKRVNRSENAQRSLTNRRVAGPDVRSCS
jgi:hypothetical protein